MWGGGVNMGWDQMGLMAILGLCMYVVCAGIRFSIQKSSIVHIL